MKQKKALIIVSERGEHTKYYSTLFSYLKLNAILCEAVNRFYSEPILVRELREDLAELLTEI